MVKVGNPPIAGQLEIFPENHEKPGGLNAGLKNVVKAQENGSFKHLTWGSRERLVAERTIENGLGIEHLM